VSFLGNVAPSSAAQVISLTPSLLSEHRVVDLTGVVSPRALSYLPDEHRIAVSRGGCYPNCSILLYDNSGTLVEQIPVVLNLPAMTYIPKTKEFAARIAADPTTLRFFSRTGQQVNSIDLSSTGIDAIQGITFFNPNDPSGGEFLIASDSTQHMLFVVDFTGNVRARFDYRATLGVIEALDLGSITSGPLTGAFSLVVGGTSEIVVFRLPEE